MTTASGSAPGAAGHEEETRRRNAAAALADDAGLDALEAALRDPSWRVRKAAAARMAEAFPASRSVPRLTRLLGDGSDAGARAAAAEALSLLGPGAVPSLAAAFSAGDERIRKSVLDVIAAAGLGSGADLARAGLGDRDANVRVAAVEALGRLRPEDAGVLLTRALSDPELLVRFAALECLPPLAPVPVAPVLAAAEEPHLRRAAIRALGRLAAVEAAPLLGAVLAGDPAQPAWTEALLAAVALPDSTKVLERASRAALRERLAGEDSRAACAAAAALARLGDASAAPALAALAARVPDAAPAAHAALARLGAAGAEALAAAAPAPEVVAEAAAALGAAEEPPAERGRLVAALRALMAAGEGARGGAARLALAAALARRGEADGVPALFERVLAEPESEQGHLAAEALRAFAAVQGAALAARLTPLPPCGARARAALADILGAAGAAASAPLRRLSRDADAAVRRRALTALGLADPALGFEEALAALADEESSVRTAAVSALATLSIGRAADATAALARALADRDLLVRVAAVRSLGALGGSAAVAALLELSPGSSPLLDLALIEALRPLAKEEGPVRSRLLGYASSNNPDVSALAHEALLSA